MEEEFIDEDIQFRIDASLTSRNLPSHIYKEEYFVELNLN
jgi:hypothetical protein